MALSPAAGTLPLGTVGLQLLSITRFHVPFVLAGISCQVYAFEVPQTILVSLPLVSVDVANLLVTNWYAVVPILVTVVLLQLFEVSLVWEAKFPNLSLTVPVEVATN